jgi:hypothetical protein
MARIFTTKFNFNDKEYDAIITVIDSNGRTSFNVRLLDVELHELVPDGHLNYQGRDTISKAANESDHSVQSLMNSIAASIEQHLVLTA